MKNRIFSKETLLYKGVLLIHIDRSYNAIYWVKRQNMTFCERIKTENTGEMFDIWENRARGLACAIPINA